VLVAVAPGSYLVRVDPTTGDNTFVATSHSSAIAAACVGGYAYILQFAGTTFWRVNLSNGQTTTLAAAPAATGDGCCMAYDGGDYIYVMRGGNNTTLWRYSISGNSWTTTLAAAPGGVGDGAVLVHDGQGALYLTRGGGTATVYRYNIAGNSWTTHLTLPANVTTGGGAVWLGEASFAVVYGGGTAVAVVQPRPLPSFAWQEWQG
jgi:outer membrane protein assembly factor BamB